MISLNTLKKPIVFVPLALVGAVVLRQTMKKLDAVGGVISDGKDLLNNIPTPLEFIEEAGSTFTAVQRAERAVNGNKAQALDLISTAESALRSGVDPNTGLPLAEDQIVNLKNLIASQRRLLNDLE